jgi:hypothetical protein
MLALCGARHLKAEAEGLQAEGYEAILAAQAE